MRTWSGPVAVGIAVLLALTSGSPGVAAPGLPHATQGAPDALPPLPNWVGASTCCFDCNLLICWCVDPAAYCADCVKKCVSAGKSAVCRINGWCWCICEGNDISIN